MNSNVKISIVLPTYNGEKWLKQSILSIINQTEKNWELIIVNDCSTDNSLTIAKKFQKQDPRISIISNHENKKLPASLNIGFKKASGKYLTWTSDDNLFKPTALAKLSEYLDTNPKTDLISMNQDIINEQGEIIGTLDNMYKYKRCAANLIHDCNIGAAFMYRKEIADKIGEYDESTFCAEDYDYWCRIALKGQIDYSQDNIYQYRINNTSLSSTHRPQILNKTIYIQKKYATDFFQKFKYTKKDQAIWWSHFCHKSKQKIPNEYRIYYSYTKIKRYSIKTITSLIFWNQELRKEIRKYLLPNDNKYSFTERKN